MCSNYLPARIDSLAQYFAIDRVDFDWQAECYPGYMAPIIKRGPGGLEAGSAEGGAGGLECVSACFGMVPHWADMKLARQTYNARSETVAEKPSFRSAWRKGQFCIIPLEAFFEPNYEAGRAVRWKLAAANNQPLGVAGIWEWRRASLDGQGALFSFSMLTINADGHPLMQRFHKPEDEKRMLVILRPEQYSAWLATTPDAAASFLLPYPADELQAEPAPRMLGSGGRMGTQGKKPSSAASAMAAAEPVQPELPLQQDWFE
jgi:putative SOS response-associated peptidase YedK